MCSLTRAAHLCASTCTHSSNQACACISICTRPFLFLPPTADRTIKIWDLASGQLKLTLTGHIEQVTGLAISDRHPYMFSCGLDKTVKCWDLEQNKVWGSSCVGVCCVLVYVLCWRA